MKLIVGLGNPGNEYDNTRHNVGFAAVDKIVEKLELGENRQKKFNAEFYSNKDVILIKPLSYMNLSGSVVKAVVDFYKINLSEILVICDDLDIKLGQAKIKVSNSANGHNGIKNIIQCLDSF